MKKKSIREKKVLRLSKSTSSCLRPMLVVVVVFFTCFVHSVRASEKDSLRNVLAGTTLSDSVRAGLLERLVVLYMPSKPDSAVFYARQLYTIADNKSNRANKHLMAAALTALVNGYNNYDKPDKMLQYGFQLLPLSEELRDTARLARALYAIGHGYGQLFTQTTSEENASALQYLQRALKLSQNLQDKQLTAGCYNAIGRIYRKELKFDSAMSYHNQALTLATTYNFPAQQAWALNSIAVCYENKGNPEKAFEYSFAGLRCYEQVGNTTIIPFPLINIARLYYTLGNMPQALVYARRSLSLATTAQNRTVQYLACERIARILEINGDYPGALAYQKRFVAMRDSVATIERREGLQNLQDELHHQRAEREKELLLKNQEAQQLAYQRQQIIVVVLVFGAVALAIAAALLLRAWRRGQQHNQELMSAITERKRAEETLLESERKFRFLTENSLDLIALHAREGHYTYLSPSIEMLLGYTPNELIGKNPYELFHPDDTERISAEAHEQALRGEINTMITYRIRHKNGSYRWFETKTKPILEPETNTVTGLQTFSRDVTQRVQMQEELATGSANLRAILDASVESHFLIDPDFRVMAWNKVATEQVRRAFKRDLRYGDDMRDYIQPLDMEEFVQNFATTMTGESIVVERCAHLPVIGEIWYRIQHLPVYDASGSVVGVSFSALEITASKKAADRLNTSEMRYRSFIELQSTYFIRTDLEGRYTYANPSMLKDFSPSQASVIGKSGLVHIIPEDHALTMATVEECLRSPSLPVPVMLRKPHVSGEVYWTDWEFIAIQDAEGIISEIQCVGHNITARHKAEEALSALNQTLEDRVERRTRELVLLNNEKNEFLGIAAHDLKNPLSGILSSADILKRYYANDEQILRFVNLMIGASEQMIDIIEKLLDVNKLESGLAIMNIKPISLAVVAPVVADYQLRAGHKNILLQYTSVSDEAIPVVLADERALWQVVDNLISNAIKYSPQWKNVWVRVLNRTDEDGTSFGRVEIQDEGPGISESDQQNLFGKFTRLTAQPTGGEHSTGLGLSIVKKLVELQGGRVWCESELGKGATFIVELPSHI